MFLLPVGGCITFGEKSAKTGGLEILSYFSFLVFFKKSDPSLSLMAYPDLSDSNRPNDRPGSRRDDYHSVSLLFPLSHTFARYNSKSVESSNPNCTGAWHRLHL